jgi:hypothetical protein
VGWGMAGDIPLPLPAAIRMHLAVP